MIVNSITVSVAGTRVQAGDSGSIKSILFRARSDNTGAVYVGDENVASTRGMALLPGEAIPLTFQGFGKVQEFYADAAANGDVVDYFGDNSGP